MGQGSQSGLDGRHPAWSQLGHPGGGVPLPDPMQRAREQFLAARERGGDEFAPIRDWWRDLKSMPEGQARGMAALGPPRMNQGPEFAPMMEVPQFPGMPQHDGTVQGLLGVLQQQTANQPSGGDADGSWTGGGGLQGRLRQRIEEREREQERQARLDDLSGRGR